MIFHALTLLQAAAVGAGAAGDVDIESLLLEKLRDRYPAIERWDIHPFGKVAAVQSDAVSIAQLGARSAVRVGERVYWYAVAGYRMGLGATRAVRTGEPLDAAAGHPREVDALAAGCTPVGDVSHLVGARARRPMRVDQVICEESIEPRPPVARGDDVTVRYVGERISLVTRGVAETDGALGQSVEVKKLGSTERYLAVVSGTQEVTINE